MEERGLQRSQIRGWGKCHKQQTSRQDDKCTLQASQWAVGTAQHGSQKLAFVIGRAGRLLRGGGAHPRRQRGCRCPAASLPRWRQQAWWSLPLCGCRQEGVLRLLHSHLLLWHRLQPWHYDDPFGQLFHLPPCAPSTRSRSTISWITCKASMAGASGGLGGSGPQVEGGGRAFRPGMLACAHCGRAQRPAAWVMRGSKQGRC